MLDFIMTFESLFTVFGENYILVLDNIYPIVICSAVINDLFELKIVQIVKGE